MKTKQLKANLFLPFWFLISRFKKDQTASDLEKKNFFFSYLWFFIPNQLKKKKKNFLSVQKVFCFFWVTFFNFSFQKPSRFCSASAQASICGYWKLWEYEKHLINLKPFCSCLVGFSFSKTCILIFAKLFPKNVGFCFFNFELNEKHMSNMFGNSLNSFDETIHSKNVWLQLVLFSWVFFLSKLYFFHLKHEFLFFKITEAKNKVFQ